MFFRASVQSPGGTPPACPVLTCMMPRPPNLQLATAAGQVPSMLPPLQQYMLTGKADRNVMQLFGTSSHVASAWVFFVNCRSFAHLVCASLGSQIGNLASTSLAWWEAAPGAQASGGEGTVPAVVCFRDTQLPPPAQFVSGRCAPGSQPNASCRSSLCRWPLCHQHAQLSAASRRGSR